MQLYVSSVAGACARLGSANFAVIDGNQTMEAVLPSRDQLEEVWDSVSSDLSSVLQGRLTLPEDVTPFDAAANVDVDQQR